MPGCRKGTTVKKKVTVNAKSVEEAVAIGAAQLGAEVAEVEYTVLEDARKGFLGMGATPARVEVSFTEADAQPASNEAAMIFLNTLIEDLELNVEASCERDDEGVLRMDVRGENAGVLIGHHGDTLDALQYLCSLAANRKDDEKRPYTKVTLDVEGYRAKREATLRALARRTAAKVKKYRRSVTLEPMNPYERRIIHSELQGFDGVTTYSVGQDSGRRVVVSLADETGAAVKGQGTERVRRAAEAPRNPVGYRTPRPEKKPEKKKSVASYFGDEEYTDDYMLDEKGEPLDIAKICGIYDDPVDDAEATEKTGDEE